MYTLGFKAGERIEMERRGETSEISVFCHVICDEAAFVCLQFAASSIEIRQRFENSDHD